VGAVPLLSGERVGPQGLVVLGEEFVHFVVLHALELCEEAFARTHGKAWSCVCDDVEVCMAIFGQNESDREATGVGVHIIVRDFLEPVSLLNLTTRGVEGWLKIGAFDGDAAALVGVNVPLHS
jgi:hypothetical protein